MRTHLFAAAFVSIAACSTSPKPSAPPPGGGSGPAANETSCSSDADCVVIQTACCDHCNGGKAEAFNKELADAHKATGCENTACTERGCGAATASCDRGTCKVTIGPVQ